MQSKNHSPVDAQPPGDASSGEIPVLELMGLPLDKLRARAEKLCSALRGLPVDLAIGTGEGQVGGGTLPRTVLPSVTVDLIPAAMPLQEFVFALRTGSPPLIGYVDGGRFRIDLRTIFPEEDPVVEELIRRVVTSPKPARDAGAG
jgi:L-seryl-tRNA(Ser) seleniumtransferase